MLCLFLSFVLLLFFWKGGGKVIGVRDCVVVFFVCLVGGRV